jgi:hypothetical protein
LKYFVAICICILCCFVACNTASTLGEVDGITGIEMDTSAVRKYSAALKNRQATSPADSSISRELKLTEKYLLACSYYDGGGWSWAVKGTGLNFTKRMYLAADLLKEIVNQPSHPLYYKALYLRARIYYWLGKEDGELFKDSISEPHFKILAGKFPDHEILKMYLGQKIPFQAGYDTTNSSAPLWASYQRDAIYRIQKIIHWWVNEKQAANGEMGGKYGDDVELLRWWMPAIMGADDSIARLGYKRLADGIWNSGILERGYAKRVDDVEHSAELFRDTHPGMFLVNYGDPEYVERAMISMQNFNKTWTGITPLGHRHFKSYFLSASKVQEESPFGVDVPLNARAVLPGLWTAWYNRNPVLLKSFSEWGHAWVADAARAENGKPAGLIPAAVTFKTDKIGGDSGTWYDANLAYSYYRWESLGHVSELYAQMLGMYAITQDSSLLKPLNTIVQLLTEANDQPSDKNTEPGSLDWVKQKLLAEEKGFSGHPMAKLFSMARKLTGKNIYDSLVARYGQPYSQYEITGNTDKIIKGFDELRNSLAYNFPLLTSEVKFTDRVYVSGSNLLMGMYTGHFGAGYEYPGMVASWKNTGPDVSVFVRYGDRKTARVSLFNFDKSRQVEMRTWQLEPGLYELKQGIDVNDDGEPDEMLSNKEIQITERIGAINIDVPALKKFAVSIRQLHSFPVQYFSLADIALAASDISVRKAEQGTDGSNDIAVRVHNIGNIPSLHVKVDLTIDGVVTGSSVIDRLDAPNNLEPKWKEIIFRNIDLKGKHNISVRINTKQHEITRLNNSASFSWPAVIH